MGIKIIRVFLCFLLYFSLFLNLNARTEHCRVTECPLEQISDASYISQEKEDEIIEFLQGGARQFFYLHPRSNDSYASDELNSVSIPTRDPATNVIYDSGCLLEYSKAYLDKQSGLAFSITMDSATVEPSWGFYFQWQKEKPFNLDLGNYIFGLCDLVVQETSDLPKGLGTITERKLVFPETEDRCYEVPFTVDLKIKNIIPKVEYIVNEHTKFIVIGALAKLERLKDNTISDLDALFVTDDSGWDNPLPPIKIAEEIRSYDMDVDEDGYVHFVYEFKEDDMLKLNYRVVIPQDGSGTNWQMQDEREITSTSLAHDKISFFPKIVADKDNNAHIAYYSFLGTNLESFSDPQVWYVKVPKRTDKSPERSLIFDGWVTREDPQIHPFILLKDKKKPLILFRNINKAEAKGILQVAKSPNKKDVETIDGCEECDLGYRPVGYFDKDDLLYVAYFDKGKDRVKIARENPSSHSCSVSPASTSYTIKDLRTSWSYTESLDDPLTLIVLDNKQIILTYYDSRFNDNALDYISDLFEDISSSRVGLIHRAINFPHVHYSPDKRIIVTHYDKFGSLKLRLNYYNQELEKQEKYYSVPGSSYLGSKIREQIIKALNTTNL